LEKELKIELNYVVLPERKSDQKFFVADITKAQNDFGWQPKVSKEDGVLRMLGWLKK
jgi:CDP-paratose 2-epimerase